MQIQKSCALISSKNKDKTPNTPDRKENSTNNNMREGEYNATTYGEMKDKHYGRQGLVMVSETSKEMMSTNKEEGIQFVSDHRYQNGGQNTECEQKGIGKKIIAEPQYWEMTADQMRKNFETQSNFEFQGKAYIPPPIFSNQGQKIKFKEWIKPCDFIQGDIKDPYLLELAAMVTLAYQQHQQSTILQSHKLIQLLNKLKEQIVPCLKPLPEKQLEENKDQFIKKYEAHYFKHRISNLQSDMKDYKIFSNDDEQIKELMKLNDIIQGGFRTCYFHAPLASIVSIKPELIYRLFVRLKNSYHLYTVRLFIDGKWKAITVNLKFPRKEGGDFCCARPNDKIIWPMLLQKAYAKVNGSYNDIQNGTDVQGMWVLTGAPSIFKTIDMDTEADEQILFWQTFEEQHKRGSIVTASLLIDTKEQQQQQIKLTIAQRQKLKKQRQKQKIQEQQRLKSMGLIANHCYSVLDVIPGVQGAGQQVTTLIRLRNPWGTKDKVWNGPWSKGSPLWTEQLRSKCNYKADSDDVSFFMCRQDFKKYSFKQITICQVQQGYTNSWLDVKCKNNDEFTAVEIQIPKDGNGDYFFTLYLKGRRSFTKRNISKRCSWLFLLKKQGQKFKQVGARCLQVENNTVKGQMLEAGKYMIVIKVKWQHDLSQDYCLSSYGPKQVQMKSAQFKEAYLNYCIPIEQSKKWVTVINKRIKMRINFDSDGGFGYIEVKNKNKSTVDVQIFFSNYKGILIVLSPYGTPVVLEVEPGKTVCCKFLAETQFEKKQLGVKLKQPNSVDK